MRGLQTFLSSNEIYMVSEFDKVIKRVRPHFRFTPTRKGIKYFNVPASFDIETSSFFRQSETGESEKVAIMYEWSFCIYGLVIVGRTWHEFMDLLTLVISKLNLNVNKRLIIYVHNLAYEFAFMRKWFDWENVFAIKARTPVYAISSCGIEFRCSYILSGYKLETLAKTLSTIKIKKLVGELDYSKLRHSNTPLTKDEIAYCVNDVKIVVAYIGELIDRENYISNIPLTKTGFVRRFCRNMCFYENGKYNRESEQHAKYRNLMCSLRLTANEYVDLKNAFQGGFTHANPFFVGKVINDVTSYDFTSSYPAVMIAEKFPMGSGEVIIKQSKAEFINNLHNYCCIFEIELFNVESKIFFENYLSESRCREVSCCQVSNGRIVRAAHLKTTITEVDYMIMRKFYTWDESKVKIGNFRKYHKGYLPTEFVKAILKLYNDKTQLKGVAERLVEYANSKEMLNSCYGMTVTDIVRTAITYINNQWPNEGDREGEALEMPDYEAEIMKYNKNKGRFLFYPWGVYITAYARRNLFSAILEFNTDYIYSDTDSVKVRNIDKHIKYIDDYNTRIRYQLYLAMKHHNLPFEMIEPETITGKKKLLGAWDFDGHYEKFKTLGAKRYMVQYSKDKRNKESIQGEYALTVSGLNKSVTMPYIKSVSKNPFSFFKHGMYIPAGQTGKMNHTYIDKTMKGYVTDYLGNTAYYKELSSVHLCPEDYTLSMSREFTEYILDIQTD